MAGFGGAHYSCSACHATSPVAGNCVRQNAIDRAGELALHRADILHAQWIPYGNDDECAGCGKCGYLHKKYDLDGMETAHSYCPECGAKMELPDAPKEGDE